LRRSVLGLVLALAVVGLLGSGATGAFASATYTTPCSDCHGGANVPVGTTPVSNSGGTATYDVSAPGASAIAVFDGRTKLQTISGASGRFSVATGKTYTIFAVKGPRTTSGLGSTSVSPVDPPGPPVPDITPPTTKSDVKATYVGSAIINLTPTDNAGGSGVAHIYYILGAGTQTEGTALSVTAVGAYSLEFWSVDASGNIEDPHKTAAFSVTAKPIIRATSVTIRTSASRPGLRKLFTLSGVLRPGDPGSVSVYMRKPRTTRWLLVSKRRVSGALVANARPWSYRYRPTLKGTYQFRARFTGDATRAPSASRIIKVTVR
jgi:hypothetical protein